ncbi:esterase-like activity of phytase family protein [Amaricoccus macauensis]|uniref:esterase-like activity of phytase family protein n=1 Tax=Amaricoccus macauensis TaxID=57001 RepID=UPI003C7D7A12
MHLKLAGFVSTAALAAALPLQAETIFNRIAAFPVPENLPADADPATETSAEIIDATEDGMTLVYSDSPLGAIGLVDITDPFAPAPGGSVDMEGEPTAVAILGSETAFVGVNTSPSYTEPSGHLAAVSLSEKSITATCDLGGQPDSVAVAPDGSFVAIAIENERDEDLNDGIIPQMPAGYLAIVPLEGGAMACDGLIKADVSGLGGVAPSDPEPEFVAINAAGEIALTMQENNYVVILDQQGNVTSHFDAGSVDIEGIDIAEDDALDFTGSLSGVKREPDAVKWLSTGQIVIANEGDYEGGSRGFTIFNTDGSVAYESGPAFEHEAIKIGHYPEARSENKGVEPEGLATGTFGDSDYIFVLSERGSVVGVYRMEDGTPTFVQALPSGIGPESAVAIPSRNLLATANEVDLIEDGGVRSHVMLFEAQEDAAPAYPSITTEGMDALTGFGALSGLAASETPGRLYAVNDSFYGGQPTIFEIDATQAPAKIIKAIRVTEDGAPAAKLDQEGIALDGMGGFWIASEGRSDREIPHAIYHVDGEGAITDTIPFADELLAHETRFGAEGIAVSGSKLWIAIQREWADDPEGMVKLVSYDLETGEWGAVHYPLEPKGEGWVGLSEITIHGDHAYILERDNQIGGAAKLKKLYRVPLAEMQPAALGGELPVVTKEEVRDFIPDLEAANGYVVDKIEGFTIDSAGYAFAVTDNDGVDDSSGETHFLKLGPLEAM